MVEELVWGIEVVVLEVDELCELVVSVERVPWDELAD